MQFTTTYISLAQQLDQKDELGSFRDRFVIANPDLIYLDGNSLGRLPKPTVDLMSDAVERQWGERLIQGWNDGWVHQPTQLGEKIAQLIGAQPEEVLVCETNSINLFKLAVAALRLRPDRTKIVSDEFNFPSDLYILQGIIDMLGNQHQLELMRSDDSVSITPQAIESLINQDTALVSLTHVAFKSAFMYDIPRVTELAHKAGAMMIWDLCHSVGAVPLHLNEWGVDLAVGCTYKYLNGGPGSPAFIYIRRELQKEVVSPLWGWFAAQKPFDFDLDFTPADDISRFRVGSIPVISMLAIEPALDIFIEAGMEKLRRKSIQQTEYLIYLAEQWLYPLGFTMGSPRDPEKRGSHISIRHPEAYRIIRALIEPASPAVRVIPDFRAPDNIRMGIAPLYNTFTDIHRALTRIREIVVNKEYEKFSEERLAVT
ncbi:MAG: kynureninase [Chloroflexi bacterium]|nr:kynureninase [Chloroflexota bacterium]